MMAVLQYFMIPLLYAGICCGQDPCATVKCSAGMVCRTQAVVCVRAPCDPIAECRDIRKSGMCPWSDAKPMLFGSCQAPQCYIDADCSGELKCCGDCIRKCIAPTRKPGKCPATQSGQVGDCTAYCTSDASCSGYQKCCGNCPSKCTDPEPEMKPGNCPWAAASALQAGPCMKKCTIDGQCPGNQKCCGNGVRYCTEPFKAGLCSRVKMNGSICKFDFQCSGVEKCCFGMCIPPLMVTP